MANEVNWTHELWRQVVRQVMEDGRARLQAQGEINDADFLAGALSAMQALGMPTSMVPASWIFGRPLRVFITSREGGNDNG